MKQGSASRDNNDGRKPEPRAYGINPAGVSQIGSSIGNHVTGKNKILHGVSEPVYAGKGFESPRDRSVENFPSGSQKRSG